MDYTDYSMMATMPLWFFLGLALFLILMVLALKRPKSKSSEYREILTDMFVVGKIKQLADEEKINLMEELKEFAKVMKAKKIDHESLDMTIERELQEKISKTGENGILKKDDVD